MPPNICCQSPRLSIIIPARNEARRLPSTLEKIAHFLSRQDYDAEVIVVDNGSTDGTAATVQEFTRQHEGFPITVVYEPRRGKGAAVRTGMLHGTGEILFLCDADLSMPIEELDKFLTKLPEQTDIAIGCRECPGSSRLGEPIHRRLMSRVFNQLLRSLGLTGLPDTQCGFKAFRRNVAYDVFAAQTIPGWGFDVEILAIARRRRYSVASVPIAWNHDADSRVRPFLDVVAMFQEIWSIRQRLRQGLYDRTFKSQTTVVDSSRPARLPSVGQLRRRVA